MCSKNKPGKWKSIHHPFFIMVIFYFGRQQQQKIQSATWKAAICRWEIGLLINWLIFSSHSAHLDRKSSSWWDSNISSFFFFVSTFAFCGENNFFCQKFNWINKSGLKCFGIKCWLACSGGKTFASDSLDWWRCKLDLMLCWINLSCWKWFRHHCDNDWWAKGSLIILFRNI